MEESGNTVHLDDATLAMVDRHCEQTGQRRDVIIRRSVNTESFFIEAVWGGGVIQIHYPDGRDTQVVTLASAPPKLPSKRPPFITWFSRRPILLPAACAMTWGMALTTVWGLFLRPSGMSIPDITSLFYVNYGMTIVMAAALWISLRWTARSKKETKPI